MNDCKILLIPLDNEVFMKKDNTPKVDYTTY